MTFFNPEKKIETSPIFGKKDDSTIYYSSKDSLSKPIDYEFFGRSYFRRQGVSFYVTIKKSKPNIQAIDTLGCYYFFEYTHTNVYDDDVYINRSDIWDSLENLVTVAKDSVKNIESHQLYLLKDIKTNKYYIVSQKSSGVFKVSLKSKGIRFLLKNNYSVEKEKLNAILSCLNHLQYLCEVEGGMKELSLERF